MPYPVKMRYFMLELNAGVLGSERRLSPSLQPLSPQSISNKPTLQDGNHAAGGKLLQKGDYSISHRQTSHLEARNFPIPTITFGLSAVSWLFTETYQANSSLGPTTGNALIGLSGQLISLHLFVLFEGDDLTSKEQASAEISSSLISAGSFILRFVDPGIVLPFHFTSRVQKFQVH